MVTSINQGVENLEAGRPTSKEIMAIEYSTFGSSGILDDTASLYKVGLTWRCIILSVRPGFTSCFLHLRVPYRGELRNIR